MKQALILVVALALSGCSSDADGGVGDAAGTSVLPRVDADLAITVEYPGATPVDYEIVCAGGGATLNGVDDLSAEAACERLALPAVWGRLITPPRPGGRVCTDIYGGPDTAHIRGTLDGRPVDTIVDRADGCGISDWDTLLSDVLPSPLGVTR